MGLVSYTSRRMSQMRRLPRSLKIMRLIAIVGIAIGTATLLIALSIVTGFEREYKKAILNFNAHVVILRAGEISKPDKIISLTATLIKPEKDNEYLEWLAPWWNHLVNFYHWAIRIHDNVSFKLADHPAFISLWDKLSPEHIVNESPKSWQKFSNRITDTQTKSVIGMTPFIYREGLIISHGIIKGIVVKGVDPTTVRDVNEMKIELPQNLTLENALIARNTTPHIIIGKPLAKQLDIKNGKITLLVPTKEKRKKFVTVKVVGTFESGLYDYDSNFALMDIEEIKRVFDAPQIAATGMELKLDDPDKAAAVADFINDNLVAPYQAITWGDLNKEIFAALALEKFVFSIIMGILVVVAAFNIVGVLILLIYHRIHEVAILKALGIQYRDLQKIFIRSGVVTGLIGTVIGLMFGTLTAWALAKFDLVRLEPEVYFLSSLPIDISWPICGMILLFSVAMCYLTSRIASKRLIRLPISEALRT